MRVFSAGRATVRTRFDCAGVPVVREGHRSSRQQVPERCHALVATRRGLYGVSPRGWTLAVSGFFFGITLRGADIFVFEACDQPRSPRKRGRIVRLTRDGQHIRSATVVAKGLDSGCHQIAFIGDRLHVMDTYNQAVGKDSIVVGGSKRAERYDRLLRGGNLKEGRARHEGSDCRARANSTGCPTRCACTQLRSCGRHGDDLSRRCGDGGGSVQARSHRLPQRP